MPSLAKCSLVAGSAKNSGQRPVQGNDDRRRQVGRSNDALPGIAFIAGEAGLDQGRNPWNRLDPLADGDAEPLHAAFAYESGHRPDVAEHHRHVAGHHVVERRPAAPIGDMLDVGAGHALEQLHVDVMRRAHAARGVAELAGLGFREPDQIGDAGDRQRRIDHQHERDRGDQRDRGEILDRIVRQLLVDGGIERQRRARRREQGVAVGRRARDIGGAGRGALAGAVLDDEGLAQAPLEAARQEARQRVGSPARRIGHDDAHRFRRIVLGMPAVRARNKTEGAQEGALENCRGPTRPHRIAL